MVVRCSVASRRFRPKLIFTAAKKRISSLPNCINSYLPAVSALFIYSSPAAGHHDLQYVYLVELFLRVRLPPPSIYLSA